MNMPTPIPPAPETSDDAALFETLLALRGAVVEEAAPLIERFSREAGREDPALVNLAHYLSLRRHELRPLQRQLMRRGLSSLGRLESRVLPTLDATLAALAALAGRQSPFPVPDEAAFFAGEARLDAASVVNLGPEPANRTTRIMVTLPSEAAGDLDYVLALAKSGMDVARINCAHDDADAWRAMAAHVRVAGEEVGRPIAVLMDIAGPKIRTEAVLPMKKGKPDGRLKTGDRLRLVATGEPRIDDEVPFSAAVSLPEIVTRLGVGDRIRYDDGKVEGVVESVAEGEAVDPRHPCPRRGHQAEAREGHQPAGHRARPLPAHRQGRRGPRHRHRMRRYHRLFLRQPAGGPRFARRGHRAARQS